MMSKMMPPPPPTKRLATHPAKPPIRIHDKSPKTAPPVFDRSATGLTNSPDGTLAHAVQNGTSGVSNVLGGARGLV